MSPWFVKHFYLNTAIMWLVIGFLAFYAGYSFPNPTSYLEVLSINVSNSPINTGEVIQLDVNRIIHSDFAGSFVVTVRKHTEGGWVTYCSGYDNTQYRTYAVLPSPGDGPNNLNLKWWIGKTSAEDCARGVIDTPGVYRLETCWTINRPWTFPVNTCHTTTNFTVVQKET